MTNDALWESIRSQALEDSREDAALVRFLEEAILAHGGLEDALACQLTKKLADPHHFPFQELINLVASILKSDGTIQHAIREDIIAVVNRDPACPRYYLPLLFFKGFLSLQAYRIAHYLWIDGRKVLALYFQSRVSEVFGVDIHPAARLGSGIMLDHATGVVIGETAVIEDNVSILHAVTLGGTGKTHGDRHPKIRSGVLIGAGAKILGNIEIGSGAKIGAGSIVLQNVPARRTAVGNPASLKGNTLSDNPAIDMEHSV